MKHHSHRQIAGRTSAFALLVPLLGVVTMARLAQAQPDVNNAPKADNPTNRTPRRLRPKMADMTPEQAFKERLRRQLINLGAIDAAPQEAVISYIYGEFAAKQTLLEKGGKLETAWKAPAQSNAEVAALLRDYQTAIEENRTRRVKAQAALQKTVDFANIPKVEALLTLLGIYGDGPTILGGSLGFNKIPLNPAEGRTTRPNLAPPAQTTAPVAAPLPNVNF